MSASPKNIQIIGEELAISWEDGLEYFYPFQTLRRACPCAMCGGEPDVMGRNIRPKVSYTDKSFIIQKLNIVGGYALQVTWGDGHDTGLYSWKYLRALGLYLAEGHKPWDENEGNGENHEHGEHQCEHGHDPDEPHHCCGGHGHGHDHGGGDCKNK